MGCEESTTWIVEEREGVGTGSLGLGLETTAEDTAKVVAVVNDAGGVTPANAELALELVCCKAIISVLLETGEATAIACRELEELATTGEGS